jgi:hypothetical protein
VLGLAYSDTTFAAADCFFCLPSGCGWKNGCKLFGYEKGELDGKNVSLLM